MLWPNETWKFFVGAQQLSHISTLGSDGKAADTGSSAALTARRSLTLAVGRALGRRAYATLSMGYQQNAGATEAVYGLGDPSLSLRYTVLAQDFTTPLWPQVQLVLGHRLATGRSLANSRHPDALDTFSPGYPESRLGIDVYQGMYGVKAGISSMVLMPQGYKLEGYTLRAGVTLRHTLLIGYGLGTTGRVLLTFIRDDSSRVLYQGQAVADSQRRQHTLMASLELNLTDQDMLRIAAGRTGVFYSHNAARQTVITLGYTRAL